MFPVENHESKVDPLQSLRELLERGWQCMCDEYDVKDQLPPLDLLLEGTNFLDPERAAETITVNMLSEVIERVDRFSPWYTLPANAFGLEQERAGKADGPRWILCPETAHQWEDLFKPLTLLIQEHCGLFRMAIMVGDLWNVSPKAG